MGSMSLKAKLLIGSTICLGLAATLPAVSGWHDLISWRFLFFLVLQILASRWKVRIPHVDGTFSALMLVTLLGISELNLPEVFVGTLAGTLYQCIWNVRKRQTTLQLLFNVAVAAVSTTAGYLFYYADFLKNIGFAPTGILLLTGMVLFALNTVPVAGVISSVEQRASFVEVWRDSYLWYLPFYLLGSGLAGALGSMIRHMGWQTAALIIPAAYVAYRCYILYLSRVEEQKRHSEEISALHLRTIEALALAIEAKDQTTANHLARVKVYAVAIGRELGMSDPELNALQAAALLHDIGKLAVPEYIISKPGKLTREEFEKMKIHPVVGAEILERVEFPYPVCPIVRSHHEKWNGNGYPDGLKGEEIPLGARILSAIDCLDALASDRQYRKALPLDDAMKQVLSESGVSFDPKVVEVLNRRYRELEAEAQSVNSIRAALSVDARIERGLEPAAGLAPSTPGLEAAGAGQLGFIASIAAAREEVQNVCELAQDLGLSLGLEDTLSMLALRLRKLISFDCIALYLLRGETLKPAYVAGENFRLFASLEIPLGSGLSGWVVENGKTVLNGNPAVEPGYLSDPSRFTTMRSALAIPLEIGGRKLGALTLYAGEREAFRPDNLRVLLSLSPKLAQTIDNVLRLASAEDSTLIDAATGLPNARSLFQHLDGEMARCKRVGQHLAIVACDVRGLRRINDKVGHVTGTEMLRKLGAELQATCRPYDFVARMGGDDFILILPELASSALERKIGQLRMAAQTIGVPGEPPEELELSIGWAEFSVDGEDADSLLTAADRRMQASKRARRYSAPMPLTA